MKDGVYHLVFLCNPGRRGVTLSGFCIVAPNFDDQVLYSELHRQVVNEDDCSDSIQGWSTDDCVVGRGLVDHEKVDHLSDLRWALAESRWQLDGPFCVDPFSTKSI